MKKETFCDILRNLHETEEKAQRLESLINEAYLTVNDNRFMDRINIMDAVFPYNLYDNIIKVLETEMDDKEELISAFVYECDWGQAQPYDDDLPKIYTLEQLYDALVQKE